MAVDLLGGIGGLASGILNVGVILLVIVVAIAFFVGLWFALKYFLRYTQFKIVIWEVLENGGIRVSYDKAGIFLLKKTGNKLLYLKRSNVGLNPDNLNYVLDTKGKKVIYLLRYGYKNFVFVNPVVNKREFVFKVGEEDVNWAVNSYEANKKRFSQSLLMQLLPFLVLALVCIIILILMISLFKQFSVFSSVAESINQASQALAGRGAVTAVTSGGVI